MVCLSVCPNKQQGGHSGKKLEVLDLSYTQITNAGCATLVAAIDSGALPALERLARA